MAPALLFAALLTAQSGAARTAPPAAPAPTPPRPAAATPAPVILTDWPFRPDDLDYPAAAMRGEEQGTVRYRVEIGPEGRVSACTILGSSGSSAIDQATCRIVRSRARFAPARDSAGNPVPDFREAEVTWRLGEDDFDE